jgi:hypothetical protein
MLRPPTPLRPSVGTGAGDRGGAPAEFAVVAETVGCREDVSMLARWSLGMGESNLRTHGPKFRTFPSKVTRGLHPTPPSNPRVGTPASPKAVTYPEGLVDTPISSIDMYNNDVGQKSAQKFMK